MISTTELKKGMVILLDGDLMQVVESQHVNPGKGAAFVRTTFKNVLIGRVLEKTFRTGEKFEEAFIENQTWQYLYHDGDFFHFMHKDTFEQIEVGEDVVGDKVKWMKEQTDVTLSFYNGRVIMMDVPFFVELEITQCDPGVQGDRATGGTKPAVLETGATVQVPLFVQQGEVVRVDTRTGEYLERAGR